jgi:hypothetical protein
VAEALRGNFYEDSLNGVERCADKVEPALD